MKRKIVNKLLAICLSISMIAGTGLPVTAAGTENTPQTTVTTEATTEKTTSSTSTLYKVKLTLPGITAATSVKSLSVKQNGKDYTYDYKDLKTDDKGVLYLKLPANAKGQTTSITVNDVSFSGTVNANDDNAFAAPPAKTESEKTTDKATEKATEATEKTTAGSESETAKGTEAATEASEATEATEKKSPETEPVTDTKPTDESKAPDTQPATTESQKATETTGQTDSNKTTPSESETTDTNGSHKASAVDNIKIDYPNEVLTNVTADMQYKYSTEDDTKWRDCVVEGQNMKISTDMFEKELQFKMKGSSDQPFKIDIGKKDPAPVISVNDVTAKEPKIGKLVVTNPGSSVYQYRMKDSTNWIDMTLGKANDLTAGTYEVRKKATSTDYASTIATATISVKAMADLNFMSLAFSTKYYGYKSSPLALKVKNVGNASTKIESITLAGEGKNVFTIDTEDYQDKWNISANSEDYIQVGSVKTVEGFSVGTYEADIIIKYDGTTVKQHIKLTVNQLKVTPTIESVESKTYDGKKNAEGKLKLTIPDGYNIGKDVPTATGKFVFDSADAGSKKEVSVSEIKLGSGFDKNYVLSSTSIKNKTTSAKINKAKNTKKPEDVKVSSFTYNSITMKKASGVEYSIDGGKTWPENNNTFKSLSEKTSYKILARYKESTNYEASKSVSVEQTTLRNPIISNPQNNKVTGVQTTTSYKTGSTLTFTATGAGSEIKSPSQSPSLDDVRYIPVSWTSYVNGTWDNNASSNSGSFKLNSSGSYTLSVSFQKQKYDGTNWVNETSTKDTKSVSYKVVTSTTTSSTNKNTTNKSGVKTGDVNPIMLMVILLVVSGAVIVVLVVRTRSKRRQHRE
ncbi:YDG domain-containing protein [Robinsoniella peoriensis]|uniref:YDG domain-containing protein n=1 Tax=Robinsoniella peoriensis TaxID=180332 RepID=UPI0005C7B394|nr:YDG domain-containing protein [Robinsoniella peoriensis]